MALFLYDLFIRLYIAGIRIFAPFSPKAKKWRKGRQGQWDRLQQDFQTTRPLVWIHCASLGEFEQGRPIIESLKTKLPHFKILLTFFSPSGYEIRKHYPLADHIYYLPADTSSNAKRFIATVRPQLAIFVKYEFWHHYLLELQKKEIPVLLVSAVFRPDQHFFKWYGKFFFQMLKRYQHIFVQNQSSLDLLTTHGINSASLGGDTRIDRVVDLVNQPKPYPLVETFAGEDPVLLFGSTWPKDEAIAIPYIQQADAPWKYIIAPHEIKEHRIEELLKKLGAGAIRYSMAASVKELRSYRVLIIDNIGILAHLYRYAKLAYIGGGFGRGIHNILEPATFGLPIIFGPNFQKFEEANELVKRGSVRVVSNYNSFYDAVNDLTAPAHYDAISNISKKYIQENKGGTVLITNYIKQLICKKTLE